MGKGQRKKIAQQQSPVSLGTGVTITHVQSKSKRKSHNSSLSDRSSSSINTEEQEVSNLEVSQDSTVSENQPSFEDAQGMPIPVVQAEIQNKQRPNLDGFERQCRSTFNDPQKQHNFQDNKQSINKYKRNNPNSETRSYSRSNKAWTSQPSFNSSLSYSGATSNVKNERSFKEITKPTERKVQHEETNTEEQEDWEKIIDNVPEFVPRSTIPEPTLTVVNNDLKGLSVENYDPWNNTMVSDTASKNDDFDDSYNNYDNKGYDYKNYNKKREYKPRKSEENWRSKSPNQNLDEDFQDFENSYNRKKSIDFVRVKEMTGDLFEMPKEYSLAHCVAEDMNMGSGIAVQFRREFKQVENLLDQKVRQGGVAFLEIEGRYIYYLVTKRDSSGKPTYEKFYLAVKKWRDLVLEHGVKKIAIPRLGCGLDRLEWDKVKCMIETLFQNVDVEIMVCNFQQSTEENASPPKVKNCKVVNVDYPLSQIESGTIVIFICSEEGQLNPEMHDLDKKFNFLLKFRQHKRELGKTIMMPVQNGSYLLCGCIARKTEKDDIIFSDFKSCVFEIEKWNRKQGKDAYSYVGFQAIEDRDNQMNKKLINLIRNTFRQVEVYVCWTGEMAKFKPPTRN